MKRKKWIAWLLLLSLCSSFCVEATGTEGISQAAAQSTASFDGDAGSYREYLTQHTEAERVTREILLTPDAVLPSAEGAAAIDVTEAEGKTVAVSPSGSTASWSFTVEQEGYYNIAVDFTTQEGSSESIERNIYIDGKVPFNEARGILFKREFTYAKENTYNILGNEILSEREEVRGWHSRIVTSPAGYIAEPLKFYLTVGQHTLSLEAVRGTILYGDIRLFRLEEAKSYEQVKAEYQAAGYETQSLPTVKLDAEKPLSVSDFSVYPTTDRSSAYTDPPSADKIKINVIGGSGWKTTGQFIRYEMNIKKSGLYTIAMRYKQDTSQGLSVYRQLTIDDSLPFAEAAAIKFNYDGNWQLENLGNGTEDYLFYLEEGRHILTLEVTSGEYATVLSELNASLDALSRIYRSLLMVTGPEPDLYRDYHFGDLLPDTIAQIRTEKEQLEKIGEELAVMSGTRDSQVTAINNLVLQLKSMGDKP